MSAYGCLATGRDTGLIEVVQNARTIMHIQKESGIASAVQIDSSQLHKWLQLQCTEYSHFILIFLLCSLLL